MLSIAGNAKIFLCQEAVDLRKGFDTLCGLVEELFKEEVTSGSYFTFINRPCNRIKVLYWDGDGLAIWYKRLEKGTFQRLQQQGSLLDRRQWMMLLEGVEPKRLKARYKVA